MARKSGDEKRPLLRVTRFRIPTDTELLARLYVDRLGEAQGVISDGHKMRILGQYSVVGIAKGHGTVVSAKMGKKEIKAGDVILVTPDEGLLYFTDDRDFQCKWIIWRGDETKDLLKMGMLWNLNKLIHDVCQYVDIAYRQLVPLMNSERTSVVLQRKTIILNLINNLYGGKPENQEQGDVMEKIIEFLSTNFYQELNVDNIAEKFCLSSGYFRRLFRKVTKQSPHEFITNLRISYAQQLISSNESIKKTAQLVGYSDQLYFMRVFKKATGLTVKQYSRLCNHGDVLKNASL